MAFVQVALENYLSLKLRMHCFGTVNTLKYEKQLILFFPKKCVEKYMVNLSITTRPVHEITRLGPFSSINPRGPNSSIILFYHWSVLSSLGEMSIPRTLE